MLGQLERNTGNFRGDRNVLFLIGLVGTRVYAIAKLNEPFLKICAFNLLQIISHLMRSHVIIAGTK